MCHVREILKISPTNRSKNPKHAERKREPVFYLLPLHFKLTGDLFSPGLEIFAMIVEIVEVGKENYSYYYYLIKN